MSARTTGRPSGFARITRDDLGVMVALLRNEAFPLPQRLAYLCLTVLMAQAGAKAGRTMRAPVEEIADLVGVSVAEVRGYIAEAGALGLMEVEERIVAGGRP